MNAWRRAHPEPEQQLTPVERARVSELEEENRRLRMENEFLKNSCVGRRLWSREKGDARVRSAAA